MLPIGNFFFNYPSWPRKNTVAAQETQISDPLSTEDKAELKAAERTIARGWDTFVNVGHALAKIRDERLYREEHKSFEAYTRDKWQYGKAYASRLIGAAETVEDLKPTGKKTLPINEAQVRPLLSLPREKRLETWQKVIEQAEGKKLTARLVSQVASDLQGGKKPKAKRAKRASAADWQKVSEAVENALEAAKFSKDAKVQDALTSLKAALEVVRPSVLFSA